MLKTKTEIDFSHPERTMVALACCAMLACQRQPEAPPVQSAPTVIAPIRVNHSQTPDVSSVSTTIAPQVTSQEAEPGVLVTARGDLNGDGTEEEVRLFSNGILHVGAGRLNGTTRIEGFHAPEPSTSSDRMPRIQIVDIDRRDSFREVMVTQFVDDEDPPPVVSFWTYREGSLRSMLSPRGGPQQMIGTGLNLSGNGVITIETSQCVRDADPQHQRNGLRERTIHRLVLTDGTYTHSDLMDSVTRTRTPADCAQMACPVVRVGRQERAVGEILRNLRGTSAETWQRLRIDPADAGEDGWLPLALSEEKREITHLDAIHVVADGQVVQAEGCASESLRASCVEGGDRMTLRSGDVVRFRFHVGHPQELVVWARGYYDSLGPGE
jgi:hypothetical protein